MGKTADCERIPEISNCKSLKKDIEYKRNLIRKGNYSEPALLKDEIRVTCDRIFDCFVSIVSLFMCRAYVGHDF